MDKERYLNKKVRVTYRRWLPDGKLISRSFNKKILNADDLKELKNPEVFEVKILGSLEEER